SDESEVDRNKCCTLCNMFFTSAVVAESHYQGKTHAKRMRLVLGVPSITPSPTTTVTNGSEARTYAMLALAFILSSRQHPVPGKFCRLCRSWFNNPMMAQQHYDGKKHKKNAARAQLLQHLGETLDSEALRGRNTPCMVASLISDGLQFGRKGG
uniref:Matrin-type domain-containing protein n=1 Tax=Latimeria chalumnae TaxID=7897 RepID=H3A7Y4_LATCH